MPDSLFPQGYRFWRANGVLRLLLPSRQKLERYVSPPPPLVLIAATHVAVQAVLRMIGSNGPTRGFQIIQPAAADWLSSSSILP